MLGMSNAAYQEGLSEHFGGHGLGHGAQRGSQRGWQEGSHALRSQQQLDNTIAVAAIATKDMTFAIFFIQFSYC
jgi:hypothetical protein